MNTGVPGEDFPRSEFGMAVQVLENRHGRETIHSMGAGFALVFVKFRAMRASNCLNLQGKSEDFCC